MISGIKKLLVCVSLCFFAMVAKGQDVQTIQSNFQKWHDQKVGFSASLIVNGPIYSMRSPSITTHQFYASNRWVQSRLTYDGEEYFDIYLVFDIFQDKLVMKHPLLGRRDGVLLDLDKVEQFEMHGHSFYRDDSSGIVYDLLMSGTNFDLIARHTKKLTTEATGSTFHVNNYYFIRLLNTDKLIPIRSKAVLKELFPDRYKEVHKTLKQEKKLKFSISNENTLQKYMEGFDEVLD